MWTCNNCENENEENFKYCWSCGKAGFLTNEGTPEINTDIPLPKPIGFEMETHTSQVKEVKPKSNLPKKSVRKEPEMVIIKPIKPNKKTEKIEKPTAKKEEKLKEPERRQKPKIPEPELFSTFLPESQRGKFSAENETDWETILFTTAVRIFGLYCIFLVLISIPDLVTLIYSFLLTENIEIKGFSDLFAIPLFVLAAKLLFYLILGVYLISSGRILLWFLPRK